MGCNINQLSYTPAQCHAVELLPQAHNRGIKQTWVSDER